MAASVSFRRESCCGVVDLYHGLLKGDERFTVHAYETWGFRKLSRELIDTLNIWARFIYAPLLDDRVRTIADGVKPSEYGRREAFRVHQALKQKGPVMVPREFVFMDRAAIGLGAVFLHLRAELNFLRCSNEADRELFARSRHQASIGRACGRRPGRPHNSPVGVAMPGVDGRCRTRDAVLQRGKLGGWHERFTA